jgi:hypothetical protein
VVTNVFDQNQLVYFHLVPNPAQESVTVMLQNPSGKSLLAAVYDYSGRLVREVSIAANQSKINIDINDLSKGIYTVKISNDSFYRSERLIKQ